MQLVGIALFNRDALGVVQLVNKFFAKHYILCIHCYTPHTLIPMKNTKNTKKSKKPPSKSLGLDREHKDITCAVRLPRSMYEALGQCAKVENTSLSDVIREALVEKMSQVEEKERQRVLKEAEYEARLRELGVDPRKTA